MHLWSYADLNERARLKAALGQNERWNKEYLPGIRPLLVRQEVRILNSVLPPKAPEQEGNVYELRAYRLAPGAMKSWLGLFTEAMAVREKYSKIVGLWSSEAGCKRRSKNTPLRRPDCPAAGGVKIRHWIAFHRVSGRLEDVLSGDLSKDPTCLSS